MLASTCIGSGSEGRNGPNGGSLLPESEDEGGMLVLPAAVDVPELCATDGPEGMLEPSEAMVLSVQMSKKDLLIVCVR